MAAIADGMRLCLGPSRLLLPGGELESVEEPHGGAEEYVVLAEHLSDLADGGLDGPGMLEERKLKEEPRTGRPAYAGAGGVVVVAVRLSAQGG